MTEDKEIINRVANSPLVTFNLEDYHLPGERCLIDLKEQLFQGLILREQEFRNFVRSNDWSQYQNKYVAITCTADAVVPTWAYMLIAISIRPYARNFCFGTIEKLEEKLYEEALAAVDWSEFTGKKVVVKGCSKVQVPITAYVEAVRYLQPLVSSLMFGEPCSTVPLYKQVKNSVNNI
jgi:hypothetical protein